MKKKSFKKILTLSLAAAVVVAGVPASGIMTNALTTTSDSTPYIEDSKLYCAGVVNNEEPYAAFVKSVDLALEAMNLNGKTDYEKCLTIYKYVTSMDYDLSASGSSVTTNYLSGIGVCEDFADLYAYMLEEAGIEAKFVGIYGSTINHACTLVKLDGKWYFCDASSGDNMSAIHNHPFGDFLNGYESMVDGIYFAQGVTLTVYSPDGSTTFTNDYEDEEEGKTEAAKFAESLGIAATDYNSEDVYWHEIPAEFDSWEVVYDESKDIPATCTTVGYRYSATVFYLNGEVVSTSPAYLINGAAPVKEMVGHEWVEVSRVQSTENPEKQELVTYECEVCHETKEKTDGHTWSYTDAGHVCETCDATLDHTYNTTKEMFYCGAAPYTVYCTDKACAHELIIDKSGKEHVFQVVTDGYVAPTCTKTGLQPYECQECEYTYTETIPATDHNWEEGVITKEPTCTTRGIKADKCTECGATQNTEVVQKLAHTYDEYKIVDNDKHSAECTVCGHSEEFSHDYVATTVDPTCTSYGMAGHKCTLCGKWNAKTFSTSSKLPHSLKEIITEPTCVDAGNMHTYCENCDYETDATTDAALGHSYEYDRTESGMDVFKCTRDNCTEEYTQAHNFEFEKASGDVDVFKCTVCGETEERAHEYNVVNSVAATCEAGAYDVKECEHCGKEVNDYTSEKLGHDYTLSVTKAPTCTAEGERTYICQRNGCDESYTEDIAKTAHDTLVNIVEPTCTEDGYTVDECKDCDYVSEKRDIVTAIGHEYDSEVTKEATCTEEGLMTYSCKHDGCDDFYTEKIEKPAHDTEAEIVAPTCRLNGYTVDVCKDCDYESERRDIVDPLGHETTNAVTKAATCTEEGVRTHSCVRCDFAYDEPIEKTEHAFEAKVIESTCVDGGYTIDICKDCGLESKEYDEAEALGHDCVGKGFKAATCTRVGEKIYACNRPGCDYSYVEEIPKKAHDVEATVVEPTCEKDGYTVDVCKDCGNEADKRDIVEKLDHDCKDEVTTEPTCTTTGVRTFTCERCDYSYTEDIDKLPHNAVVTTVAPTCEEDGYTADVCQDCGDVAEKRDIVEKLGHEYESEVTKESTCTETGVLTFICQREGCKGVYTEDIAMIEHELSDETKTVTATCETDGYTADVCKVCDQEVNKRDVVKATGHEWEMDIMRSEAATYQSEGKVVNVCKTCDKEEVTVLDKLVKDESTDDNKDSESPKTGDATKAAPFAAAVAALFAGTACLIKRRRRA